MHATRPAISLRLLMPIALLTLLAGLLLLPDQAHAQNAPTISGSNSLSFPEGTPTTTVLATYTASDADMDTLRWVPLEGDDAGDFTLTENLDSTGYELRFNSVPNYEVPTDTHQGNVYNVTVKVYDSEDILNIAELPVTVTVTNVNETPVITSGATSMSVAENYTATVSIYGASDPDALTTFTWSMEGTDADAFTITKDADQRGVLVFSSAPDYESPADGDDNNVYSVTVKVTDDGGDSAMSDHAGRNHYSHPRQRSAHRPERRRLLGDPREHSHHGDHPDLHRNRPGRVDHLNVVAGRR